MRIVRPLVTAAVVAANAALVTAAAVAIVDTNSSGHDEAPVSVSAEAASRRTASPTTVPPLGPITTDKLPPLPPGEERPDESAASDRLTQTITVTIQGGSLRLEEQTQTVTLTEQGQGLFRGTFGPVTVVDARGTLAGWDASVRVLGVPDGFDARVRVRPDRPEVVHGERRGLRRRPTAVAVPGQPMPLFSATEGHGGGTYTSGGIVDVHAPSLAGTGAIEVGLEFSVS